VLALLGALLLVGLSMPVPVAAQDAARAQDADHAQDAEPLPRLAGQGRIETAVTVSEAGWVGGSARAVLAAAHDFPDALAATALAASLDAPLLLDTGDRLHDAVAAELERLMVEEVVLVGGRAALPDSIADDVAALPRRPSVRRVDGADRWQTAAEVAAEVGADDREVLLALGTDFPDAVAAGGLGGADATSPLLLSLHDRLPSATREAFGTLAVDRVRLLGGPTAIAPAVVEELADMGIAVTRLEGSDRFGTSVAVAREALAGLPSGDVPLVLATGAAFADALPAGALAARLGGTLVLVPTAAPHAEVDALLTEHGQRWGEVVLVGGSRAISPAQATHLGEVLAAAAEPEPTEPESTDPEPTDPEDPGEWYSIVLHGPAEAQLPLEVEVAADSASRRRGLQHREEVPEGTGMLFLFPEDTHNGFWMKDTLVPLSIAFLHADGTVQEILDMEPCEADPCPSYRPRDPYRMALEVRQGAFDDAGVTPGWVAELPEDLPEAS
jgi:uncharacterized membrane protein (UPF0127 family)/putative cell wall-binding protein